MSEHVEGNNAENISSKLSQLPSETSNFADLYPERKGPQISYTILQMAKGKNSAEQYKERCGINAKTALEWPLIKLMLGALKSQGCITDMFERHFSCDICKDGKSFLQRGGYDESSNQVFVCANNIGSNFGQIHGTILRNLIHMYDVCVRKVDFKNVDHLACMEVRKANLAGCELGIHLTRINPFSVQGEHANCVYEAATNVLGQKLDNPELAKKAVTNVFTKCYNDMEPIGRRCRDGKDHKRAYEERYLFAYD